MTIYAAGPGDDPDDQDAYGRHRDRMAQNAAEQSKAGRDIGALPPVKNPKRKEACRRDLRLALVTYFPAAFPLPFSSDHGRIITKLQLAILEFAVLALAMPRGSGKTTICERAIIWAIIYAHHLFALLIAADQAKAKGSMEKIKQELETNELLHEDFPEITLAIRKLERIANRAKGQTYQGQPTRIVWSKDTIVMPTIAGSAASGAVLKCGGLLSAVRGANHTRFDGSVIRPTCCLLDDPQTRASARSLLQIGVREQIVAADVLGLAGPGKQVTAIMPCTVIERGDMADRILDRSLHPEWQGERTKLLNAFPTNMTRWQEYREVIADKLMRDATPDEVRRAANAFYRSHRAEMDAGADVAWAERKQPGDLSALQSAMNLYFQDIAAFFSEYQNEPQAKLTEEVDELLKADVIARRINNIPRGNIPLKAQHVTAFIDVQGKLLYWMLCWWTPGFTGGVIDYGTWPEQNRPFFTARDAAQTLQLATGRKSLMAAVRTGLDALIELLAARKFTRPDGVVLNAERIMIDSGWGKSAGTVFDCCRESTHHRLLRPTKGVGLTASKKPMSEWGVKDNEKAGDHWIRKPGKRAVQFVQIDVNYWKSLVHDALVLAPEEPLSISLFKAQPHEHRHLAEHLSSETRSRQSAKGTSNTVDVWELKPAAENHWFDCLVGCAVAASEGPRCQQTVDGTPKPRKTKKRLSTEEIRQLREQRRNGAA
jgi:hypothetical protein